MFGSKEQIEIIDDNGSTLGHQVDEGKGGKSYRTNYRLHNFIAKDDKDKMAELIHNLVSDNFKFNTSIEIKRGAQGERNGTVDIIICYSTVEYR